MKVISRMIVINNMIKIINLFIQINNFQIKKRHYKIQIIRLKIMMTIIMKIIMIKQMTQISIKKII